MRNVNGELTLSALPAITSELAPDVRLYLEKVRETLSAREGHGPNSDPLDMNMTQRQYNALQVIPSPVQVMVHLTTPSSQALAANTITQITGLTASITPSNAEKRIRITVLWNGALQEPYNSAFGLQRVTTNIGSADIAGTRAVGIAMATISFHGLNTTTIDSARYTYIDSPAATAAVTYTATVRANLLQTLYNQRTVDDLDSAGHERIASTIILEEIN